MIQNPFSETTLETIRRTLSLAETGKAEWNPASVYVMADDNRFKPARKQVTLSIGFTEGGGNLKKLLERYCLASPIAKGLFGGYLAGMGSMQKPTLANDGSFVQLLKRAGSDPIMANLQKQCFDEFYLGPAFAWAFDQGFKLPLSFLVIADSFLHSGSVPTFLRNSFTEPVPRNGGDEKKWIEAYLRARHKWLRNHSNPLLPKTVYRANCYLAELGKDNWDLGNHSITMNGMPVYV